ncbi:hypothetical protein T09_13386, partial [Trichinella sp. T9]
LPKNAVKAFEVSKQAIVNATLLSHALDNEALSLEMDGGLPWRSSLADLNTVKPGTVRLDASCWPSVWSYVAFNIFLKDDISPSGRVTSRWCKQCNGALGTTAREVRQLDYVTSFTSDVRHIKKAENALKRRLLERYGESDDRRFDSSSLMAPVADGDTKLS